jgi:hypothetical protein
VEDMIEVTRTSILTGKTNTLSLPVTQKQLDLYEETKELIQEVMPNLDNKQREFIKTGITEQEWDKLIYDSSNDKEIN